MDALSGAPRSDPVPVVVAKVIWGELRRPFTSSPLVIAGELVQTCEWVVDYVIQRLADADYLRREAEERPDGPEQLTRQLMEIVAAEGVDLTRVHKHYHLPDVV